MSSNGKGSFNSELEALMGMISSSDRKCLGKTPTFEAGINRKWEHKTDCPFTGYVDIVIAGCVLYNN